MNTDLRTQAITSYNPGQNIWNKDVFPFANLKFFLFHFLPPPFTPETMLFEYIRHSRAETDQINIVSGGKGGCKFEIVKFYVVPIYFVQDCRSRISFSS